MNDETYEQSEVVDSAAKRAKVEEGTVIIDVETKEEDLVSVLLSSQFVTDSGQYYFYSDKNSRWKLV